MTNKDSKIIPNIVDTLDEEYIPTIFKLPQLKDNILKYNTDHEFSPNIDYPKFSLGFHHFIHQSKDKMSITSEFEGKKKVYLVFNKFERDVDNYDQDIRHTSAVYFSGPQPDILSRAFFKLWEILFMFDLVPLNKSNFISAHLAEGPGSFIQATMFYRDKFIEKSSNTKNDKYYAVTVHSDENKNYIPEMNDKFIKYYEKEKPNRVFIHKTYPKSVAKKSDTKDNGDITDPKTIRQFGGNFKDVKADFVTADGGFDWKNENVQEQEAYNLILAEIILALKIQAKCGNFVCKIFESFTETTIKFIIILLSFYTEVYCVKPLTSRRSNSEKYLVCMNFKYADSKEKDNFIKKLETILEEAHSRPKDFLVSLFPEYNIPEDLKTTIIKLNTSVANFQFIRINQIVDFINKQNYRGDLYQKRRQMQIDATKYWIDMFYPTNKDFDNKINEIADLTDAIIQKNETKTENLKNKLS